MSLLFAIDTPFFDANGAPLAFGTVYFGEPNQDAVTNPKVPYTDDTLGTPLSATQVLTIGGKFAQEIWLDGDYSIVIKDADDVQVAEYMLVPEPEGGGGSGVVETVVAGVGIAVDSTDPANPIVTAVEYLPVTETTTARTIGLTDARKFLYCTNAAGCAITVPPQSAVTWLDNTTLLGIGSLENCTFVEGSGVTIIKPDDRMLECYAKSEWALRRLSSDVWALTGYLVLA